MVLNEGIGGLEILPSLVANIPTQAEPIFAEVGQDLFYFVKVANGNFCFIAPCTVQNLISF